MLVGTMQMNSLHVAVSRPANLGYSVQSIFIVRNVIVQLGGLVL